MANHSPNEWEYNGRIYTVQAGQLVTSIRGIVDKCGKGVSEQNVRTALKRFEKHGFLTNKSTNQNRLITIVNWSKYQNKRENSTNDLTGSQQTTNKQLTGNQQTTNRHLTTNNNDNNDNNVNNENNIVVGAGAEALVKKTKKFVPPTFEQVQTYCYEINSTIDPQAFIDYYVANGWKVGKNPMREWKAAVRTWDRNNVVRSRSKTKRETNVSIFVDAATESSPSQKRGDDLIDI